MKVNYLLYSFLMVIAVLLFFMPVPDANLDLIKNIASGFMGAATGGAIERALQRRGDNEKNSAAG